jgi:hypothetical protein
MVRKEEKGFSPRDAAAIEPLGGFSHESPPGLPGRSGFPGIQQVDIGRLRRRVTVDISAAGSLRRRPSQE